MLGIVLDAGDLVTQVHGTWDGAAAEEGMAFENQAQETALQQQTADLVVAFVHGFLQCDTLSLTNMIQATYQGKTNGAARKLFLNNVLRRHRVY